MVKKLKKKSNFQSNSFSRQGKEGHLEEKRKKRVSQKYLLLGSLFLLMVY
jgi:hypothetical protein